jgi:hypothetical protein
VRARIKAPNKEEGVLCAQPPPAPPSAAPPAAAARRMAVRGA